VGGIVMSWHKPIGKGVNKIGRHQETKGQRRDRQGTKLERTRRGKQQKLSILLFSKATYVKMSSLISVQAGPGAVVPQGRPL